jgi:hypothetical protein
MRRRRHRALPLFALVPLALVACSGDDSGGGDDGSGDVMQTLIGRIPSAAIEAEGTWIVTTDYDAASELAGLERPDPDADDDELTEWLMAVTGVGDEAVVATLDPRVLRARLVGDAGEQYGWSVGDVSSFAEASGPGELFLIVDTDSVSTDDLDAALEPQSDGRWETPDSDDPLITALDGNLVVSTSEELVDDWADQTDPLSDNERVMSIAEALDANGAYSAIVAEYALHPFQDVPEDAELMSGFDGFGVGLTVVDGAPAAVLVYHYPSEDEASDAVEQTRTVLTEGTMLTTRGTADEYFDDVEVSADGQTVVATATFLGRPMAIWNMVVSNPDLIVVSSS